MTPLSLRTLVLTPVAAALALALTLASAAGGAAAVAAARAAEVAVEAGWTSIAHQEERKLGLYRWELTFDGRDFAFHAKEGLGKSQVWKFGQREVTTVEAVLKDFNVTCAKARVEAADPFTKPLGAIAGGIWAMTWTPHGGVVGGEKTPAMVEDSARMLRVFLHHAPELVRDWQQQYGGAGREGARKGK